MVVGDERQSFQGWGTRLGPSCREVWETWVPAGSKLPPLFIKSSIGVWQMSLSHMFPGWEVRFLHCLPGPLPLATSQPHGRMVYSGMGNGGMGDGGLGGYGVGQGQGRDVKW